MAISLRHPLHRGRGWRYLPQEQSAVWNAMRLLGLNRSRKISTGALRAGAGIPIRSGHDAARRVLCADTMRESAGSTAPLELEGVELKLYNKDGKNFDLVKTATATCDPAAKTLFADGEVEHHDERAGRWAAAWAHCADSEFRCEVRYAVRQSDYRPGGAIRIRPGAEGRRWAPNTIRRQRELH